MALGQNGNGGLPRYHLENLSLLAALLGIAEVMLGAAVCVSLAYVNGPTLESQTFALASAAIGSVCLVLSIIVIWNDSVIKPREAERLVRQIPWGGDEVVADVTCGSGLILERAAGRLTEGLALGIDVWRQGRLGRKKLPYSVNSISGAPDLTRVLADADSRSLPLKDEVLDVAVSGFGTRRFHRLADRIAEVDELMRVLKPGGTIVLMVTGDPVEVTTMLKRKGLVNIDTTLLKSFLIFPTRIVSARKLTNVQT